jgi:hypothetical protein
MMASKKPAPSEPLRKPSRGRTIGIASAIWGVSIFLSRTLMKVPIGVFGMAAGVAAYPTISRMVTPLTAALLLELLLSKRARSGPRIAFF